MNHNQVAQHLDAVLTEKKMEIGICSQYAGGWEGWLQVEMMKKWPLGSVYREQYVWGNSNHIDLWFPETRFGVELKCLGLNRLSKDDSIISHIDSTYRAFAKGALEDVDKVKRIPNGNGVAIVIIPTWVPEDRIETLKKELSGATYVWRYMGGEGFVVGINSSHLL